MDFKLTGDLPRDVEILYEAVKNISEMAEGCKSEFIKKNDKGDISLILHLMDLSNELKQAVTCAQMAFWEKNRQYGKN